ncbi:MAG: DUF742 domain-containing protein [Acidimicrobiia bacterium]
MSDQPPIAERPSGRPVVRPYVLTRGRTRTEGVDVPLDAVVIACVPPDAPMPDATPEALAIVESSQEPLPLVEIAARIGLALGVARVLVGDLANSGVVSVRAPRPVDAHTDTQLLERLLDGIRAL